jgi:hypothetical protein
LVTVRLEYPVSAQGSGTIETVTLSD